MGALRCGAAIGGLGAGPTGSFGAPRSAQRAIKPPDGIDSERAAERLPALGIPAWFVDVAKEQKRIDDSKPAAKRVGIGGELHYFVITPEVIQVSQCHQFDDFDAAFQSALDRSKRP